ncbi:hypothetical protein ACFWU5_16525 [Nocardia sp. NPDC058640]|uniref:hypothetical protein n=1 Tax=Nocardia sp. NPDC058640 TaxID=3346571 RepID=UPI003658B7BA
MTTTYFAIRLPGGTLLDNVDYLSELTHHTQWLNNPEIESTSLMPVWDAHADAVTAQHSVRSVLRDLGIGAHTTSFVEIVALVAHTTVTLHEVDDAGEIIVDHPVVEDDPATALHRLRAQLGNTLALHRAPPRACTPKTPAAATRTPNAKATTAGSPRRSS